jgi:hypothetical protein
MSDDAVTADELQLVVERDLARCSSDLSDFFTSIAFTPLRWRLSPWGDRDGGVWAIAKAGDRVVWYNDIEGGFNVSRFVTNGEIPADEYWCNQDDLCLALVRLISESGGRPPLPYSDDSHR